MSILYHLTKKRNIDNILTEGLIANKRAGLTRVKDRKILNRIWLTNDIDYISRFQAGDKWCKNYDAQVLEINTLGLTVEPMQYRSGGTYTLSNFEFLTVNFIEKERILKIIPLKEFLDNKIKVYYI